MKVGRPSVDFNKKPLLVFWEVTRACALACRHCRAEAMPQRHPDELTTQESLAVIDQLAGLEPGFLIFTGGDPLMRRDLFTLMEYANGQGLRVGLSPAATNRLTSADFAALKAVGVRRISLSIDGPTKNLHDLFRGAEGTFDRTMQAVEMAHKAKLSIQINTTITAGTISFFSEFLQLMKKLKPDVWSLFLVVPTGRAEVDDLPDPRDVEYLWNQLEQASLEVPFEIKTTEGHHYRRVLMQMTGDLPNKKMASTRDGKGVLFISHIGEIQPSGFLPITTGNVRKDNIGEVYRNHDLFKLLRDDNALKGKCGFCGFREVCGGSRSRSWAIHGDVMAPDPLCCYEPPVPTL